MANASNNGAWAGVSSVRWLTLPAGPLRATRATRCSSLRRWAQVWAGEPPLRHPDEEQAQEAEQHVGGEAVLASVVDGTQLQVLRAVPPAPLHLQELLLWPRGDARRSQAVVAAAREVRAMEPRLLMGSAELSGPT